MGTTRPTCVADVPVAWELAPRGSARSAAATELHTDTELDTDTDTELDTDMELDTDAAGTYASTIALPPAEPTGTDEGVSGNGDPWDLSPKVYESPGRSLRNHWKLAALFMVLALLAGLAVAAVRTPTHTAETRLIVGKTVNLNNLAATPGLSVAGTELAVTYSRLLATPSVIADAEKRAGSAGAGGSVAASPVPQSPIIRVEGTGPSAAIAVAQANAGANALIKAVGDVNAAQQSFVDDVLKKYQEASGRVNQDKADLQRAQTQSTNNPTNAQFQEETSKAQTKLDTDTLVLNNLATQYGETASPEQVNAQIIQKLGSAQDTGNDRRSIAEMALLIAVVVGGLWALGIAVLIDKREPCCCHPKPARARRGSE